MQILKVIAHLLDYPTQELIDNIDELKAATQSTRFLPAEMRQSIVRLIDKVQATDVYDLQEQYDGLFERGRYVSLMIFEHVHGESRDRGQAMVDLLDMYKSKGFEIDSRQMPDYIPLFLEFLSEQEELFAREWLADVAHIFGLLEQRLDKRGSEFQCLLTSLLIISGVKIHREEIREKVDKEEDEDTIEAIDRAWEDKEIRFDEPVNGESCSSSRPIRTNQTPGEVPIHWHEAAENQVSNTPNAKLVNEEKNHV